MGNLTMGYSKLPIYVFIYTEQASLIIYSNILKIIAMQAKYDRWAAGND